MAVPPSSGETKLLDPSDRASLYQWTRSVNGSGFEEKSTITMDEVQKIDTSNLAPSSETFRDELATIVC
jgi:hypothetical protein